MTPTEPGQAEAGTCEELAASAEDSHRGRRTGSGPHFDEIRELFTLGLRPMVTAAGLQAAWEAVLAERGQLVSVGAAVSDPADGAMVTVRVPVAFERGRETLAVYLTRDGQLAGIQLGPAADAEPAEPWEPPGYADPDRFDEAEVTLGAGLLAVAGHACACRAAARRPASGGGAARRLGAGGPRRQHRAEQAAQGPRVGPRQAAVSPCSGSTRSLHAHPDLVSENRAFTVADEYLPDARAAIALLQAHPAVDAARGGRGFLGLQPRRNRRAPRRRGRALGRRPGRAGLRLSSRCSGRRSARSATWRPSPPPPAAAAQPGIDALAARGEAGRQPRLCHRTPRTPSCRSACPRRIWLDLRGYDPVTRSRPATAPADAHPPGRPWTTR